MSSTQLKEILSLTNPVVQNKLLEVFYAELSTPPAPGIVPKLLAADQILVERYYDNLKTWSTDG